MLKYNHVLDGKIYIQTYLVLCKKKSTYLPVTG